MFEIEPSFKIDKKGRVFCKKHTNYINFTKPHDYLQDLYLEVELTCKTCSHYRNNECYFSKSRIDEIEKRRIKRKDFLCKLCGKKIERMLTIIHQLYNKETYNIELPLICCDCYEKIEKNEFLNYSKKIMDFYLLNIVMTIFFYLYFIYFVSLLKINPIIFYFLIIPLLILFTTLFVFIIFRCGKKLHYLINGVKFYKKSFRSKASEIKD